MLDGTDLHVQLTRERSLELALAEGQDVFVKNTAPVSHNVNWNGGVKNPGNNLIVTSGAKLTMDPKLKASKAPVAVSRMS